jgi:hypothetical protein
MRSSFDVGLSPTGFVPARGEALNCERPVDGALIHPGTDEPVVWAGSGRVDLRGRPSVHTRAVVVHRNSSNGDKVGSPTSA